MKNLKVGFLIFLLLAPTFATAQQGNVEDFGRGGLLGSRGPDLLDRAEGLLGNELSCNPSDRAELNDVDCALTTYSVLGLERATDFDGLTEELIFLEAARRSHEFTKCQVSLHQSYASDLNVKNTLHQDAYRQFQHISGEMNSLLRKKTRAQEALRTARRGANYAEDKLSGTVSVTFGRLGEAERNLGQVNLEINALMATIPMGNRPQMKTSLLSLFERRGNVSQASFNQSYTAAMAEIKEEADKSGEFFGEIARTNIDGELLYSVNEDLKKTLVKTGQVENVVRGLGLETRLARGFMCRATARYDTGPSNLMMAEIPLYFLGAYGLGRLALRAGVATIRATSAAARASAQASQWLARGAMLGLDAYEYARISDVVRQTCWPQEFIAATQAETCSAESELNGVYQEASIAQCLAAAAFSVAPLAVVGGLRILPRGQGRAADAIDGGLEVVVTAPRRPLRSEAPASTRNQNNVAEIIAPVRTAGPAVNTPVPAAGALRWRSFRELGEAGLGAADVTVVRSYLQSLPANVQRRLREKFRAQSPEATLNDLHTIRDLRNINGTCR